MADKFLNETGLTYYHNRAKTIFENKIEKVKVNGTEVTPTNKEVDLNVAEITKTIVGAGNPSIVNITQKDGNSTVGVEFTTPYHSAIADETMYIRVGGPNGSSDQWGALFPTKTYVDNNGGKIDKITVNGSTLSHIHRPLSLKHR